jgi:protein TonB
MIGPNRIVVPAAVTLAVAIHVGILFLPVTVRAPETVEESVPVFAYVDAIVVEAPPAPVLPPAAPEPEQAPELVEVAPQPEPVASAPPEPVTPRPLLRRGRSPRPGQELTEGVEPTSSPARPLVFLPFYRVEKRPEFISRAALSYPPQARRERVKGTVIVEADIDAQGRIVDTRIVRDVGFGLGQAAVDMLLGSTFSPAEVAGRAVAVRMRFTVEFELR